MNKLNHKGFSLIEVMIGVAVFVLFTVGIYSGIQFVFKVVYQSRLKILETGILNEQVEIIRNLPFENVGIINGSPAGVLTRTVTTTRNGIPFTVTRTIRNIDDPFDGTAGGNPPDTAPADFKMVDIEITCDNCGQRAPLSFTTQVAPKLFEGDPTHGALYIEVFDSEAKPVQGATAHVTATFATSSLDVTDTTDNDGMLRLVDLEPGMNVYNIVVSKSGYTTDQTRVATTELPYPVKTPASVQAQDVTEISFSIDKVSSLQIETINSYCNAVSGANVQVLGTKLMGTEPDTLKVNQTITTNGGVYNLSNLEWDSYGLKPSSYDLIGSIPALPVSLPAGATQPVQLILGANTANSLLINVTDSITGQPLSNATVHITGTGLDQTKTTGVGFMSQTDWSGGDDQELWSEENKYFSDDGKIETGSPEGDVKLRKVGADYVSDGQLESSIFDLGLSVNFINLFWYSLSQPVETGENSARFQVAVSTTSTPESWNYVGPDGTGATYFNFENQVFPESLNNNRYLRYKMFLTTADQDFTPAISDVIFTYITSCTPPGQVYFGNLSETAYTIEVVREGYQTKTETVTASGDMIFNVAMVAN